MIAMSPVSVIRPVVSLLAQQSRKMEAASPLLFQGMTEDAKLPSLLERPTTLKVGGKTLSHRDFLNILLAAEPKKRFYHRFGILLSRLDKRVEIATVYSKVFPEDKGFQCLPFDQYLSKFPYIDLPKEKKATYTDYKESMRIKYAGEHYDRELEVLNVFNALTKSGFLEEAFTMKQRYWLLTADAKALKKSH